MHYLFMRRLGGRGVLITPIFSYLSRGYWKGRLSCKPRPVPTVWGAVSFGGCQFYLKLYYKIDRIRRKKPGMPRYILTPVVGLASRVDCYDKTLWYAFVDGDSETPPKEGAVVWVHYVARGKHAYHAIYGPYDTVSKARAVARRYSDNKHLKWGWRSWWGPVLRLPYERIIEMHISGDIMGVFYKTLMEAWLW